MSVLVIVISIDFRPWVPGKTLWAMIGRNISLLPALSEHSFVLLSVSCRLGLV